MTSRNHQTPLCEAFAHFRRCVQDSAANADYWTELASAATQCSYSLRSYVISESPDDAQELLNLAIDLRMFSYQVLRDDSPYQQYHRLMGSFLDYLTLSLALPSLDKILIYQKVALCAEIHRNPTYQEQCRASCDLDLLMGLSECPRKPCMQS